MVYVPVGTLATTKDAANVPPESEHVEEPTTCPNKEQVESLVENPAPETRIVDPAGPDVGIKLIEGGLPVDVVVSCEDDEILELDV